MRRGFGRGLVSVSTLLIGCVPVILVFVIAFFAFSVYVAHIRDDASKLFETATRSVASTPGVDAIAAGDDVSKRLVDAGVVVVLVDALHRVVVLRDPQATAADRARRIVRARADLSGVPTARGGLASLTLGLGTIFGLQTLRTRVGQIDISTAPNEVVLVGGVRALVPAFVVSLAIALVLAVVATRLLAREALRPLSEVTRALERFSAGDFSAEFVVAESDPQLGALAHAYNGAVEQVERAFAERAHAAASMRQFIADAGHQFRTPITVMRGFVSLLGRDADFAEPPRAHILDVMQSQIALMSTLVDKLVLLERWENEDAPAGGESTNLTLMVSDVVEPIALATPGRISVHAEPDIYAAVRSSDLEHALVNVVDNAVKYTSGAIDVSLSATETLVRLAVTDQGPGMQPDDAARAFDRFFRGNRRDVAGSGLGLAIAKRATERAGGTVEIASDPATGTRIEFNLPRSARSGETSPSVPR